MALLTSPDAWLAFVTLTVLELVLGIDNVIFIAILVDKLPVERREITRRIGLLVAQRLSAFGVELIAYDPYVQPARAAQLGVRMVTLDELLAESDFITVHLLPYWEGLPVDQAVDYVVDRLDEHGIAVGIEIAEHFHVGFQTPGADAEEKTPFEQMVDHRHRRRHVNLVEIRPFLAIHFDADKMAIHDGGDRRVFKRLPLHHMAPVTGRVADRQQDRLVRRPGGGQRFRPPGIPIDGVIGMLQEIGTGLGMEPVRLAVRCG